MHKTCDTTPVDLFLLLTLVAHILSETFENPFGRRAVWEAVHIKTQKLSRFLNKLSR